eukprot:TRINITY_DN27348_c0_g1_i1.p1 TRINITY_DN27348_c0_g1~~TRINITY_DN27348_c0_g1_i1.p1  ORF type:complete len:621 (+),score=89.54 TRINITY_DN27348_c0_g1_i1:145-1863(+)
MNALIHQDDVAQVQRAAERYAFRMIIGTSVVAGIVGIALAPRTQLFQVRRIRRTLRRDIRAWQDRDRRPRLPVMTPLANALKDRFAQPPRAPLIVTGPEGVGKATLLHHAMQTQQRKGSMCLYLSLSEEPVRTSDAFVRLFVDRAGFLVSPANTILVRSLLRTRPDKSRISDEDIEKAFKFIEVALSRERDSGWRYGVPIICIEEMHTRGRDMIDTKNPMIGRFLEWCGHLCLNQLAHVVFVASIRAAMKLENEAGLQYVRDLMFVDFPNTRRLRLLLAQTLQDEAEQDMVLDKLGSDTKDAVKVIYAVKRGTPVALAVEDCIVEAVQFVEREVSRLVSAIVDAGDDDKLRFDAASRFCRFWKLMERFSQKPRIQRKELVETVCGAQHSRDLVFYVEHGLLTYTLRPVTRRLTGDRKLQALHPRTTWPDEWLAVGSPCYREAFTRILRMPHNRRAFAWASATAKQVELIEESRECIRHADRLRSRTSDAAKVAEIIGKCAKDSAQLGLEEGVDFVSMWGQALSGTALLMEECRKAEENLSVLRLKQRALDAETRSALEDVRPKGKANAAPSS